MSIIKLNSLPRCSRANKTTLAAAELHPPAIARSC
jgi:hypothetical protein